ncbi:hypothetical protein LWC34_02860 [Kibdelosporangium philippinense]|uniref:Uncharacterized protein n=1 Tax=Kibdelosporangium philippinense TaxID=211113 RepID=A0ABS8Z1Y7_9PSEU|nr:hypothetical protein [Kibdelosporangium philippinense]MCE7001785.1 hypothetical protein [Kibdelosporangium philippinense]
MPAYTQQGVTFQNTVDGEARNRMIDDSGLMFRWYKPDAVQRVVAVRSGM